MQKSASFITEAQLTQNQSNKQFEEYFQDQNQISFDRLLQKSDDENINNCMDSVFRQIKIKEHSILKQIQNKQYKQNKVQSKIKVGVSNIIQQIGEMRENSKLKMENKKLQLQINKIKDKYQKILKNKEKIQKQQTKQLNQLKKCNEQLKNKIKNYENQIKSQKQKTIKLIQVLKQKQIYFNKQKKKLKEELQNQNQQKQNIFNKYSKMQKNMKEIEQKIQLTQKNLRIKQKQSKKLEQLQQERNKFYQITFSQKQQFIDKLKQQLKKKSQQMLKITQQQSDFFEKYKKQTLAQLCQKNTIIQQFTKQITKIISIIQEYLNKQTEKRNMFDEIKIANKFILTTNSKNIVDKLHIQTRKLQKIVTQMIELYKINKNRNLMQIKNFQQIYTKQFDDLDIKMGYLAQQNKQLKYYQQNLLIKNQQLHRSLNKSRRNDQQKLSDCKYKFEEQKLRQNMKIVKNQRLLKQNEYKKFMNTTGKLNHSKIRQQVFQKQTYKNQQNTYKIFEQISHRKSPRYALKPRNRQNSQPILRKRSRTSLSWKKPAAILQQYV